MDKQFKVLVVGRIKKESALLEALIKLGADVTYDDESDIRGVKFDETIVDEFVNYSEEN